jgi:hypothetical protein
MDLNNKYGSIGNSSEISSNSSTVPQIARLKNNENVGQTPHSPVLNIKRYAYSVSQFNEAFNAISTTDEEKCAKFKLNLSKKAWIRRFRSLFPITVWLPEYNIRENLFADILVGVTIAIFQVPQSN